MSRIIAQPGQRLAIRVDADTLLSVPPMHPKTPHALRVQVLELVLRGLYGEAHDLAMDTAEAIVRTARKRDQMLGEEEAEVLAGMLSQAPHSTPRSRAYAA